MEPGNEPGSPSAVLRTQIDAGKLEEKMKSTHGFECLTEKEIPELRTRAQLFRHAKTPVRPR